MPDPVKLNRFRVQISQVQQNLRLTDAQLQQAIVAAEQAGDFSTAETLSAKEAELEALKTAAADTTSPQDDKVLAAATDALVQLNKKMQSIMDENKSTAALINDFSNLPSKSSNLWQTALKKSWRAWRTVTVSVERKTEKRSSHTKSRCRFAQLLPSRFWCLGSGGSRHRYPVEVSC